MGASKDDQAKEQSKEKAKVRRWILKAIEDVEGNKGATANHIQKFLDSKENGISNRPEWKVILKKLLDSGNLMRNGGRYVFNKSKKTSGNDSKGSPKGNVNEKGAKKLEVPKKK